MRPKNTSHRFASPGSYEGRAPLFIVRGSWRPQDRTICSWSTAESFIMGLWPALDHDDNAERCSIKYSLARVKIRLFEDADKSEARTIKSAACSTKYVVINLRPQYTHPPSNLIQTGVNCKASLDSPRFWQSLYNNEWLNAALSIVPPCISQLIRRFVLGWICPPAATAAQLYCGRQRVTRTSICE